MKARSPFLFAVLFFMALSAAAQQPTPAVPAAPPVPAVPAAPPHDPVGEALFPPELVMQNQQAIGLTDEQKTYIRSEVLKAQTHFTEVQWQLQDAMETLTGLLQQNPVDETKVMAQLDKILPLEREIKRTQMTLMIRIKNKLSPEQQEKLRAMRPAPRMAPRAMPRGPMQPGPAPAPPEAPQP